MSKVRNIAVGILLVKGRIQSYYATAARLEADLSAFKAKHGYCAGRPYCMNQVSEEGGLCVDCKKERGNPKYKKRVSEYGKMRRKEKAAAAAKLDPKKRREKKEAA